MAAAVKGPVAVEDVNVTFEDQQKINKFARNSSRMSEFKSEIEAKKKSLQNLQDASDDLMMLDDDCQLIPYQIGNVFISHTQEETQEMLETAKEDSRHESSGEDDLLIELSARKQTSVFHKFLQVLVQKALEQEVGGLEDKVSGIQQVLGDLKVQLYAKFGNNINLEADES